MQFSEELMMFSNRESTHLFTHTLATSKAAVLEGEPSLLKLPLSTGLNIPNTNTTTKILRCWDWDLS
jgi:hypothetical protein